MDDRGMVDRRGTAPRATILQGSSAPLCAARALSWFRSTLSCSSGRRFHQISLQGELERPVGYDPTSSAWRAETLPLSYGRVVGRGRIRTSEPLKGRRLRRRCFGLLHTCPCWLRRAELNGLSLGHEPSELPVLHSESPPPYPPPLAGEGREGVISATARRSIGGRARTGGRPRS